MEFENYMFILIFFARKNSSYSILHKKLRLIFGEISFFNGINCFLSNFGELIVCLKIKFIILHLIITMQTFY